MDLGRELGELHERNGVRLVRSSRVVALRETGAGRSVVLDTGETLPTDLAVLGLGAAPNLRLASAAGLDTDDDPRGSAAAVIGRRRVRGRGRRVGLEPEDLDRVRSAHWDNARRQGRTAARNMLGMAEVYDRIPYFFSDQFDLGMEVLGRPDLGREQHVRRLDAGLVVAWTRANVVVAAAHTNTWDSRKPLDRLIASGAVIDPDLFRDPAVPLDALAGVPA